MRDSQLEDDTYTDVTEQDKKDHYLAVIEKIQEGDKFSIEAVMEDDECIRALNEFVAEIADTNDRGVFSKYLLLRKAVSQSIEKHAEYK